MDKPRRRSESPQTFLPGRIRTGDKFEPAEEMQANSSTEWGDWGEGDFLGKEARVLGLHSGFCSWMVTPSREVQYCTLEGRLKLMGGGCHRSFLIRQPHAACSTCTPLLCVARSAPTSDPTSTVCLDLQLENAIGTDHSEVKSPSLPADPSASIPSYPK